MSWECDGCNTENNNLNPACNRCGRLYIDIPGNASERTCNLCDKRRVCTLKTALFTSLSVHEVMLGKNYDDIYLEIAKICDEFRLED